MLFLEYSISLSPRADYPIMFFQVSWNPNVTGILATCSLDRKVQVFSMVGARMSNARAPKWLVRPCGASFGFGGKLVSFGKPADESQPIIIQISRVRQDPELVTASQTFEAALKDNDLNGFCMQKELQAKTTHNQHVWQFMQVCDIILFLLESSKANDV